MNISSWVIFSEDDISSIRIFKNWRSISKYRLIPLSREEKAHLLNAAATPAQSFSRLANNRLTKKMYRLFFLGREHVGNVDDNVVFEVAGASFEKFYYVIPKKFVGGMGHNKLTKANI